MSKRKTTLNADEIATYKRAIGRINKQLQRLEKKAKEPEFAAILDYAYRGAMHDIKALTGSDEQKRFPKSVPENRQEYRKIMNMIKRFYKKPTSTITGIKTVYKNRAKTWSAKLGADVSWQELAKLMETGLWQELKESYGSETAARMIAEYKTHEKELKKALADGKRIQFTSDYKERWNNAGYADMTAVLEHYMEEANATAGEGS